MIRNVKDAKSLCKFVRGKPSLFANVQLIKSHNTDFLE